MGSVRDRIRNLQQQPNVPATTPTPSSAAESKPTSVTQLTKHLETTALSPSSNSSGPTVEKSNSLTSRLAKFDNNAPRTKPKTPLSATATIGSRSPTSTTTTSVIADTKLNFKTQLDHAFKKSAQLEAVSRTASNKSNTSSATTPSNVASRVRATDAAHVVKQGDALVTNTKKLFEQQQQKLRDDNENKNNNNNIDSTTTNNLKNRFEQTANQFDSAANSTTDANGKTSVFSRAAAFTQPVPSDSSAVKAIVAKTTAAEESNISLSKRSSSNTTDDAVAARAALFERRKEEGPSLSKRGSNTNGNVADRFISKLSSNAEMIITPAATPRHSDTPSKTPMAKLFGGQHSSDDTNNNFTKKMSGEATRKAIQQELSIAQQLEQVKSLNNQLVKSLIDLTENYRRLEISRDSLQKRIADLEGAAK